MADAKQWGYAAVSRTPDNTGWRVCYGNDPHPVDDNCVSVETREDAVREAYKLANQVSELTITGMWVDVDQEPPTPEPRVVERTFRSSVKPGRG